MEPDISTISAALGDPVRARMIQTLMDGRARTATELALAGDVAPSTASAHLARLQRSGLVQLMKQGRHRYFSILDPAVAAAIEQLMGLASRPRSSPETLGPDDPALRAARVCYDHLAGSAGIALVSGLITAGHLSTSFDSAALTESGQRWLDRNGIDVRALERGGRPLCRLCLDWSERRWHLAGAVGHALLARMLERGMLRRIDGSRAVRVTPRGRRFLDALE